MRTSSIDRSNHPQQIKNNKNTDLQQRVVRVVANGVAHLAQEAVVELDGLGRAAQRQTRYNERQSRQHLDSKNWHFFVLEA